MLAERSYMKILNLTLFLVISFLLSGCATAMLAQSNRAYVKENRVPIIAEQGVITVKVYHEENSSKNVYKIETGDGDCYLSMDGYRATLALETEKKLTEIGTGTIKLMDKKAFAQSDICFGPNETGMNLVVVGELAGGDLGVEIDCKVTIYTKDGGQILSWNRIDSQLPLSTGAKIAVSARSLGYFLTVPVDIVSAPLFVAVLLVAGAANGFDM